MQTQQASAPPTEAARISQDLQIRKPVVEAVVAMFDEGLTVPYLVRFGRERAGGLEEPALLKIRQRLNELRQHADRRKTVLKNLEAQGKLTDELKEHILAAETPRRLDDLFLPFKPKKKPIAVDAKERGLEPLALAIWNRDPAVANLEEVVNGMVAPEKLLLTTDDIYNGVSLILQEMIGDMASLRAAARPILWETGKLTAVKNETASEEKTRGYKDYLNFSENARTIPPHRILAVNRGERENALKVKVECDLERIKLACMKLLNLADHPHQALLLRVADEAIVKQLMPSLEKEVRKELVEVASEHIIGISAHNLRGMLMQRPLGGKKVLAIDPGLRNGCRVVVLSENGDLLEEASIHPHSPAYQRAEAKHTLEKLIRKHQVEVIAIGSGTASRETEVVISELLHAFDCKRKGLPIPADPLSVPPKPVSGAPESAAEAMAATIPDVVVEPTPPEAPAPEVVPEPTPETATSVEAGPMAEAAAMHVSPAEPVAAEATPPAATAEPVPPVVVAPAPLEDLSALPEPPPALAYAIVNEAGANDYSTSPTAREEFPEQDPPSRAAISIGRRLQEPLRELAKMDPMQIGISLYHQDVKTKQLRESLEGVIESCVNHVGVELNSASVPLLKYVAGLNPITAREIVDYRSKIGGFKTLEQLNEVPNLAPEKASQAVGFLRIANGDEPLDATPLHPNDYAIAKQVIAEYGFSTADLKDPARAAKMRERIAQYRPADLAGKLQVPEDAARAALNALRGVGGDPRDNLPAPILKTGMMQFEDLKEGQEIQGTVLNVVPFGAFVDIGLRDSGLVHISQMAGRFIRDPFEIVAVGDIVKVWILKLDGGGKKVSLTMLPPGGKQEQPRQEQRSRRDPQDAPRPPRPAPQQGGGDGREGGGGGPPRGQRPGGQGQGRDQRFNKFQRKDGPRPAPEPASPPPPPRKPQPDRPLPKLSEQAKAGKSALNTFGELAAFFKAKEAPPEKPAEKPPEKPPETPKPEGGA